MNLFLGTNLSHEFNAKVTGQAHVLIMNAGEWIAERGPSCPVCGAETRKEGAVPVDGGEQTDGLFTEVAWLCARCGHGFQDAALARQNEAVRASAFRLRTLARQLMRSSHVQRKS